VPGVERRRQRYDVDTTPVPSLIKPKGYEPPPVEWLTAGDDHLVRVE
jgi:hypothetical protein